MSNLCVMSFLLLMQFAKYIHCTDVDLSATITNLTELNSVLEEELNVQRVIYSELRKRLIFDRKERQSQACDINEQAVVFDAILVNEINPIGPNQIITYDNVITNEGNAYDVFSGLFQAPIDGIYQFIATLWSQDTHYIEFEMMTNGLNICNGRTTTMNQTMGVCSAIVSLVKGDRVWVRHRGHMGDQVYGNHYPSFVGHRIS